MKSFQKQEDVDEAQTKLIKTQKQEIQILRNDLERKTAEIKENQDKYHESFLQMARFASQPCCKSCWGDNEPSKKK